MGTKENRGRNRVAALEGRAGLVAAGVLGVVAAALAVAQWMLLPDQVVTHFGVTGEANGWSPKWLSILIPTGLGLFGSIWLGVSRDRRALLVAAIGVLIGIVNIATNGFTV
ncbi:hypothetical protein B5F40_04180 [Gordonibacter sp. An230]|uniref:DUF1648 domain-containing protein n=1 Tax=Gordonibacter sp. An230 TaxID=1965592 RepID=UPI000B3990DA|nr:DUF1648 domain-containing protein [Gordonibacter sp. An230]OUO91309.1 hypothetical protein B5F40_04180 [Gordonibacter sp. An230]